MGSAQGGDGRQWNSPLRKKLAKRAKQQIALTSGVTPKELMKSPSQKKSERGRAKELKRAGVKEKHEIEHPNDCRDCPDELTCAYDRDLKRCHKPKLVVKCERCGIMVRIRLVLGQEWKYCPVCREMRE